MPTSTTKAVIYQQIVQRSREITAEVTDRLLILSNTVTWKPIPNRWVGTGICTAGWGKHFTATAWGPAAVYLVDTTWHSALQRGH